MKFYKFGEEKVLNLKLTTETNLDAVPEVTKNVISRFASVKTTNNDIKAILVKPLSPETVAFLEEKTGSKYEAHNEEFVIKAEGNNIVVYANDDSGVRCGIMTFLRLLNTKSCFNYTYIYDYPFSSFRGVKIYMPGKNEIQDYKDFVDMMMYYRSNKIMIEVGGAMEYKRHPEINEGWEAFCKEMTEYSGKANKVQDCTYPWRKNSMHVDNGAGSYISQEQVKELVKYAEDRGIEVIPEVPSSSHCDYLLTRHPELAERCEDPYPDTFCLSNPASYELLFDVFDEVIEVFKPNVINVGHDEFYSINVCDRCRKRLMDTHDLFAEDLTKIHDYLAEKGVKTMFWCDKLLNVLTENGSNFGGAINYVYLNWDRNAKFLGVILPTWQARDILPRDIICMNWFWSFGEQYDEDLREYPVVFGNFNGTGMKGFRKRCGNNTSGGMCSNWGGTNPRCLQRNDIYFTMAFNDNLYWNTEYDDTDEHFTQVTDKIFEDLFAYNNGPEDNYGNQYIELLHTTDRYEWYHPFFDGELAYGPKYEEDYYLGDYVIKYTDGTTENNRLYLGESIAASNLEWYGKLMVKEGTSDAPGTIGSRIDSRLKEICYSTIPVKADDKIFYKYLLKNPCPEKTVESVEFKLAEGADWTVEVKDVKF